MKYDGVISSLLEMTTALVVRVVELSRDAAPLDPAPIGVRVKDLTGAPRADGDTADPQDLPAAPHQPGRPDILDESRALNEAHERHRQPSERSENAYDYGRRMAERDAKQRGRFGRTDYDLFDD